MRLVGWGRLQKKRYISPWEIQEPVVGERTFDVRVLEQARSKYGRNFKVVDPGQYDALQGNACLWLTGMLGYAMLRHGDAYKEPLANTQPWGTWSTQAR